MNKEAYFDSPQEEEKEVKKSLELLEKIDEERFDINHRGIRKNSMIILKHYQHYPPRKVFDACMWGRILTKMKGQ